LVEDEEEMRRFNVHCEAVIKPVYSSKDAMSKQKKNKKKLRRENKTKQTMS